MHSRTHTHLAPGGHTALRQWRWGLQERLRAEIESELRLEEPWATLSFYKLPLTGIGFHSLGIYIVNLLSFLSSSVKMTVSPSARMEGIGSAAGLAAGESVIKCPSPPNVLKDTYDNSYY